MRANTAGATWRHITANWNERYCVNDVLSKDRRQSRHTMEICSTIHRRSRRSFRSDQAVGPKADLFKRRRIATAHRRTRWVRTTSGSGWSFCGAEVPTEAIERTRCEAASVQSLRHALAYLADHGCLAADSRHGAVCGPVDPWSIEQDFWPMRLEKHRWPISSTSA